MADTRDLLIEIGTEELPPKALRRLSQAFAAGITAGLAKADLAHGEVLTYASPRRLAVHIRSLQSAQADRVLERRGPALRAAFDDDGRPTRAAQGFAGSCGVAVEALEKLETEQGAWLVFRSQQPGQPTAALVPAIVEQSLAALPIPKRMRWGSLKVEFVRPVHWVVLLFGDEVIDAEVLGIRAGRETRGHRFLHPGALYLGEPEAYAPLLETEGHVLADFDARREAIRAQVLEAGVAAGGRAVVDEALLDEVTALVEWPRALAVPFEERFLEVPAEALVSAMHNHQKCFHVVDGDGRMLPSFITVANIESRDEAQVVAGNARVMRARLSDADFFYRTDLDTPLADRLDSLRSVVFQQQLGSLFDKAERVGRLAAHIADRLGFDPDNARRAGMLSKCDLMTSMVGEFPELQGIMGEYYAAHAHEPGDVPRALNEQYMPRFSGDALPSTDSGRAVAIADKLDTLVGIFGIGQPPSGDKDPFALRRAAVGVLRILVEGGLPLDLTWALAEARGGYDGRISAPDVEEQVFTFMLERLRAWYQEEGVRPDVFEAVLATRPVRPLDFHHRIHAVAAFRELPEAESLAAANKRVHNILKKTEEAIPAAVDAGRLVESAERELADQVAAQREAVRPLLDNGDYTEALRRLAGLRAVVDAFFDQVLVMAEDPAVRANRLALLSGLRGLFLEVADISRLQS